VDSAFQSPHPLDGMPPDGVPPRVGHTLRLCDECRDFLRFIRRPRLGPRLPLRCGRNQGLRADAPTSHKPSAGAWWADWCAGLSPLRTVQWALLLWACNLVFLAPLAVLAAQLGGAQHRFLGMVSIPWLQALLWAPLVEELLFRHGLRRPAQALWVVPAMVVVLTYGMQTSTAALLLVVLLAMVVQAQIPAKPAPWMWRKTYRHAFPWVFYVTTTLFALLHLMNFSLHQTPLWLWPLLVLPQWCTGLVLGWLRVRRGIGAAILLHAIFNGGPLLLVWLLLGVLRGV